MAGTVYTSTSAIAAFVKTRFPQREIESLVNFNTALLKRLPRKDDLDGAGTVIPIKLDDPQGLGATLGGSNGIISGSTAASQRLSSSKGVKLTVVPSPAYSMLTIDGPTMLRMRSNEGAFFRARETEVKGILAQMGRDMERKLWSAQPSGSLGTLASDPGTGTDFTLATVSDALNFHEGMYIQAYADSSGVPSTTARAGGDRIVSKVDYDSGVITVTAAIDAAVGSGDHLVRSADEDYVDGAVETFRGVQAWIPASAPSATSFFGLDRTTVSLQKIAGHRQTWLGSIEETAKKLDSKLSRVNQRPKTLWLSYSNFNRLDMELSARGYRKEGEEGVFGRQSLMMASPNGMIEVCAGPYVPDNAGFLLDMETWELHTLGPVPHIVQDDGNVAMRVQSLSGGAIEDAIEMRFRALSQLVCTRPFANGRFVIS